MLFSIVVAVATASFASTATATAVNSHPWSGKKVVYLGDSITDPSQLTRHNHSIYWKYMQELYGIEPHVYAVSGYQWDRIFPMAQKMQSYPQGQTLLAKPTFYPQGQTLLAKPTFHCFLFWF